MNATRPFSTLYALIASLSFSAPVLADDPAGYAFIYQGQLKQEGKPVAGPADFKFRIYNDEAAGMQIGPEIEVIRFGNFDVDGRFTINLDFGEAFNGDARWLEIEVDASILTPRQPVRPVPMALALPGLWTLQNATSPNIIGGYCGNEVGVGIVGATIGGGGQASFGAINRVMANYATVGGGASNTASDEYATVSGGYANLADGTNATIGGGLGNDASGYVATVSGGINNHATGHSAAIGGGSAITASGGHSFVGGGSSNTASGTGDTVSGGWGNTASGFYSTIGGGMENTASGFRSTVPGGHLNRALGQYSFAAGRRAKADHGGTFVWADETDADFVSTAPNQFLIRATGGVGIGNSSPDAQLMVRGVAGQDAFRVRVESASKLVVKDNGGVAVGLNYSSVPVDGLRVAGHVGVAGADPGTFQFAVNGDAAKPGGGSWSVFSDARLKHSVQPLVNDGSMLDRLLSINGYTFEYHDHAVENRLALPGVQTGLIAQEVAEVFPDWVDEDDEGYLYITERGTTAIFVEALRELRAEKDAEIASLRAHNEELEQRLARLEAMLLNEANTQNRGTR